MPSWTPEQIIALAPDSSSAKAGKELATAKKWTSLGENQHAAWGLCQGSGKDPYQTRIDLTIPAFKCSCPSRKFPCKHSLGLFLLLAQQPGLFSQHTPPDWVNEWLAKKTQTSKSISKEKTDKPVDPEAQAERLARREDRVRQGLEDLELWLADLVRNGLGAAASKPTSFWETPAARLVDAQAPGLARELREMASIPGSGDGWEARLLSRMARLHLIVDSFSRIDTLSLELREDIRARVGFTLDQSELVTQTGVNDHWVVLGKRVEEELLGALGKSSFLKVQRTWLWGRQTGRPALLLQFAAPGQMLDVSLMPGVGQDAELVYYPSGAPLRALVKKQSSALVPAIPFPGYPSILEANRAYTTALIGNPWLDLFPYPLKNVIPCKAGQIWGLRDADGYFLPIQHGFPDIWTLMAVSGGHPVDVFGEWDGESIYPLTACADGRLIILQPPTDGGGK